MSVDDIGKYKYSFGHFCWNKSHLSLRCRQSNKTQNNTSTTRNGWLLQANAWISFQSRFQYTRFQCTCGWLLKIEKNIKWRPDWRSYEHCWMYYCPTKLCSGERHFTNRFKETNECTIITYSGTTFKAYDFTSTKIVPWGENTTRRIWSRRIDNENIENTTGRVEKRLFWSTNGLLKFCDITSTTYSRSDCFIRSIWHVSKRWILK